VNKLRPPADVIALGLLFTLAVAGTWMGPGLVSGGPLGDTFAFSIEDIFEYYIPMFTFLGERLRALDIPGWNPYTLSGAPFAGNPETGWMYLPAMVFFSVLPPVSAYTGFVLFHLVLAGFSAYALGRMLGLNVAGATVAGIAYQFSPFVEGATCCSQRTHVASWLPLALIGVELGLRGGGWRRQVAGWGVGGLAVSQMLGGWLGQGAYYGLLAVGAYVFFRTLLAPPLQLQKRGFRPRLVALLLHGAAILVVGFGLAAAGVLPRVEATDQSNLAGGVYRGTAATYASTGGWDPVLALDRVFNAEDDQTRWYIGAAVLTLAVVAPFIARQRATAIYFVVFSSAVLLMTLDPTPLHRLLYLLPRFQVLHEHVPNRVLVVFFIGPALLAGMTVDAIMRPTHRTRLLASVVLLPSLLITTSGVLLASRERVIDSETYRGVLAVSGALGLAVLLDRAKDRVPRLFRIRATVVIPAALVVMVIWDAAGRDLLRVAQHGILVPRVPAYLSELPCLDEPKGAARFLQSKEDSQPLRYFGFDPEVLEDPGRNGLENDYRTHVREKRVQVLLVGNQSICLGLFDIQGFDSVQPLRYVEYMTALNGREQEYHESNVLPPGLRSPLLDALNAQHVVVPADAPAIERKPLSRYPKVFEDADVVVLERPSALPRAWIVHEVRQVAREEALALMSSGSVDLRRVALVEDELPPLERPRSALASKAVVTMYEPDSIEVRADAAGAGLLVISEVYDPAWRAYVNGVPTPVFAADHVLRAVQVPAGVSTIELRYESPMLQLGILISGLTCSLFLGLGITALWQRRQRFRANHVSPHQGV
jgi:hypothetical protein